MSNERTKEEFYQQDHEDEDNQDAKEKRLAEAYKICEAQRQGLGVRIASWYLNDGRVGRNLIEKSKKREEKKESFRIRQLGYSKHGSITSASAKRMLKAVEEGYEALVQIDTNLTMFGTITDDLYWLPLRALKVVAK